MIWISCPSPPFFHFLLISLFNCVYYTFFACWWSLAFIFFNSKNLKGYYWIILSKVTPSSGQLMTFQYFFLSRWQKNGVVFKTLYHTANLYLQIINLLLDFLCIFLPPRQPHFPLFLKDACKEFYLNTAHLHSPAMKESYMHSLRHVSCDPSANSVF